MTPSGLLWGLIKGTMYEPHLPNSLPEITARINAAIAQVTLTNGSHIEHLQFKVKKKLYVLPFKMTFKK